MHSPRFIPACPRSLDLLNDMNLDLLALLKSLLPVKAHLHKCLGRSGQFNMGTSSFPMELMSCSTPPAAGLCGCWTVAATAEKTAPDSTIE